MGEVEERNRDVEQDAGLNFLFDDGRSISFRIAAPQIQGEVLPDPVFFDFDEVAVFEFREQCFLGRFSALDEPALHVPAHASRSLRITPLLRPNRPVLIGTDMSLSQGLEVTVGPDGGFAAVPTGWTVPLKLTLLEPDGSTRTAPAHLSQDGRFSAPSSGIV